MQHSPRSPQGISLLQPLLSPVLRGLACLCPLSHQLFCPIEVSQSATCCVCSVSDEEVNSQSSNSSSSTATHSNGQHAAADIDWDTLGFGIEHMAAVRAAAEVPCSLAVSIPVTVAQSEVTEQVQADFQHLLSAVSPLSGRTQRQV